MSIKKKIFFANAFLMIVLLVLVFILSFSVLRNFIRTYMVGDVETLAPPEGNSISIYEVQTLFDSVIDIYIDTSGYPQRHEAYSILMEYIEETGTKVLILKNTYPAFEYGGTAQEILDDAKEFDITNVFSGETVMYADSSSFIYTTVVDMPYDAGRALFLVLNENLGVSEFQQKNYQYWRETANDFGNSVGTIAIIGIIIILIINLTMITAVTKSITQPLNILNKAAKSISAGNLDFKIEYNEDDEIGEVLQSFEVMRQRLLDSMDKQSKTEQARKELIAGISHDLRTPMTSIQGYISGVIDGIADTPEKRDAYLRTASQKASEMNKLVDELFLYSKSDMDKIPLELETVEFIDYMTQCCEDIQFDVERKGLVLTLSCLCSKPVYVKIDRAQFARVLINIADNSAKYKQSDIGSLFVTLDTDGQGHILVEMKDNGKGVDPMAVPRIFDSFYRSDAARTNPDSGSGLGLAISKNIIEAHGGRIWAESSMNDGMTIFIKLNIEKDAEGGKSDETNINSRR